MTIMVANAGKKMRTLKMSTPRFLSFLGLFFILMAVCSCGGPSDQELLIGEWLIKDYEKIIILNANGTWMLKPDEKEAPDSDSKAEKEVDHGKQDKESEKEAKEAKEVKEETKKEEGEEPDKESFGLWDVKDKTLMISSEKDVPEIEWKKDDKFDFQILELTPEFLKLKDHDGVERIWEKPKEEKKGEGKEGEKKEEKPKVIEGDPLVINLVQKLQYGKDRYLCIKIDYHFKNLEKESTDPKEEKKEEKKEGEAAEPFKYQFIHPEVKDAIIMHLGELQYRDVRNYDKIKGLREGIEKRIESYFHGDLAGIVISDAVITSNKDSIEQFLGQYAPEPEKKEGAEGEKGKEKEGAGEKKSAH